MTPRARIAAAVLGVLLGAWTAPAASQYGEHAMPELLLGGHLAGDSVEHRLRFSVTAGDLETYRASIRYPPEFVFNGFPVPGPSDPPGPPVGAYELDFDGDGVADVSIALRGADENSAYLDLDGNGEYSPGLEPIVSVSVDNRLGIRMPWGGDANAHTVEAPYAGAVSIVLFAGAFDNPATPGTYSIEAAFVSVDPDTDGASDGIAPDPLRLTAAMDLEILPAPSAVTPFAALAITTSRHRVSAPGRDTIHVNGRFFLGADSDGIDPANEEIAIDYGPFSAVLPPGTLSGNAGGWRFVTGATGVRLVEIRHDGRFNILARGLDLSALDQGAPVVFGLRIGNDAGTAAIAPPPAAAARGRGR